MLYLVRWVLCPPQPQARETAMMVSWPLSAMCSQTFLWTLRLASYSFTDMCSGSWKNASLLVSSCVLNLTKHFKKFAYTSIKKTHMYIYMCCEWHWFALYLNSFIGAAMSLKSLFSKPYKAHLESYRYVTYKCMYRVYRLKYEIFICNEHCSWLLFWWAL